MEVGHIAIQPFTHKIGKFTDGLQRYFGIIQKDSVVQAQTFLCLNLVTNLSEAGITISQLSDPKSHSIESDKGGVGRRTTLCNPSA